MGAVPSLFLDLGSLSLLWNAFTVSLQPPPAPFCLIKHRWSYGRAARSLNRLPPRMQAPQERGRRRNPRAEAFRAVTQKKELAAGGRGPRVHSANSFPVLGECMRPSSRCWLLKKHPSLIFSFPSNNSMNCFLPCWVEAGSRRDEVWGEEVGEKIGGPSYTTFFYSSLAPSCDRHLVSSQDSQGNQGLDLKSRGKFSTKWAKQIKFTGLFIIKTQISPQTYPTT